MCDLISEHASIMDINAGEQLIEAGGYIKYAPLVCSGALKVMRSDDNGDEIFLYYIERGNTCAMTFSCCMAEAPSEVSAVAEDDSTILAIPKHLLPAWFATMRPWQDFVLQTYNQRFQELLNTIDEVAFHNLDTRLSEYLQKKARVQQSSTLAITHQEIAQDLFTSREVISRLLKQLEKKGVIRLERNRVDIL